MPKTKKQTKTQAQRRRALYALLEDIQGSFDKLHDLLEAGDPVLSEDEDDDSPERITLKAIRAAEDTLDLAWNWIEHIDPVAEREREDRMISQALKLGDVVEMRAVKPGSK